MRFERIEVDRYGPLAGVSEAVDPGVQLVHGPNESGKTLLVEALLALLTGERPAGARVDGEPTGRVHVVDGDGGATLDGDRTLLSYYADRFGHAFTPAEFRNVFVIRDSEVAVEGGYYESVTDRITGLRSDDIRSLMAAVREAGRLTETRLDLSGAAGHGDPAGQRERARELRRDVGQYLQAAREDSLDATERELFEARRRARDLEADVEALEAAAERERVADLRATVADLEESLAERADLPPREAVDALRREVDAFADRGADEDALARELEVYRPVAGLALLLAVLGAAALLLVDLGPLGPVVPAAGVAASAWALFRWGRANRRLASVERTRADLLARAGEAGLAPDDVADLRATVADLAQRRRAVDSAVDQSVGALRRALDVEASDPWDVAEVAARKLDERAARVPDVDRDVSDASLADREAELERARERVEDLSDELSAHRERLAAFERRAADLDFERFTGEPLDLDVASLTALETLDDRLGDLVEAVERDAEVARTAHDVLASMAAAEGEKVESLFGPDSRASEVFRAVTGGRYEAVQFDVDVDAVVVSDGRERLRPGSLSHGTRDQLFFAVRVGLAEQLLGGERGFFLLDDAFLASDPARLDRQVELLERLAGAGWQVLYLTAKADARDRLLSVCRDPIELSPV